MKIVLAAIVLFLFYKFFGRFLMKKYVNWKQKKDKEKFLKENPQIDKENFKSKVNIRRRR